MYLTERPGFVKLLVEVRIRFALLPSLFIKLGFALAKVGINLFAIG